MATREVAAQLNVYQVYNVQAYGALPANTGAQNTTAIQAALNAAGAAGGGTVYVPTGTYKVARQGIASVNGGTNNCPYCLSIPANVTLRGDFGGSVLQNLFQHQNNLASNIADNILLMQGSQSGVFSLSFFGDSDPLNATHSPDVLLSGVNDAYGSGQGGYAIVVAGTLTAAPFGITIQNIFVTGMRQGTINFGGDNITATAQMAYACAVRDVGFILQQAAVLRVMAGTFNNFVDFHGLGSGEVAFINGPFNHCSLTSVDWVGSADLVNSGFGMRFITNNGLQASTDVDVVNISMTGKRSTGISIQANDANAAFTWDGLKFTNVAMEQSLATGGTGRGFEVLAGASSVVNLMLENVVMRTPRVDAFYFETVATQRVMATNCSAEAPNGAGYNMNGAGLLLLSNCECHMSATATTTAAFVLNAAGTLRLSNCHSNLNIGTAIQLSCAAAGQIVASNCQFAGQGGTTTGVSVTAAGRVWLNFCDLTSNGTQAVNLTAGQIHLDHCDLTGGVVTAAATLLQTSSFRNCRGYNPRGQLSLTSTSVINPAMGAGGGGATGQPATVTNYTNVSGSDLELIVLAAGTVTQWIVTGTAANLTVGSALTVGQRILLPAGQIFQCTNTAVPTLFAYGW